MQIAKDCVVTFHYTLTNGAGDVIDESPSDSPLSYLHGASNIIPGLENQMAGRQAGDAFACKIPPDQGYGEHQPQLVQQVPRTAFPEPDAVTVGMRFNAQSEQGDLSVVVTGVDAESVTVDANHPLAGEELHFDVRVENVRAATAEEIAHGHVH